VVRDWRRAAVIYWLVRVFMQGQARVVTYDARIVIPLFPTEHGAVAGQGRSDTVGITGAPGGACWFRREGITKAPYLGGGGGGLGVPVVS
jgi:hypothetical protein